MARHDSRLMRTGMQPPHDCQQQGGQLGLRRGVARDSVGELILESPDLCQGRCASHPSTSCRAVALLPEPTHGAPPERRAHPLCAGMYTPADRSTPKRCSTRATEPSWSLTQCARGKYWRVRSSLRKHEATRRWSTPNMTGGETRRRSTCLWISPRTWRSSACSEGASILAHRQAPRRSSSNHQIFTLRRHFVVAAGVPHAAASVGPKTSSSQLRLWAHYSQWHTRMCLHALLPHRPAPNKQPKSGHYIRGEVLLSSIITHGHCTHSSREGAC